MRTKLQNENWKLELRKEMAQKGFGAVVWRIIKSGWFDGIGLFSWNDKSHIHPFIEEPWLKLKKRHRSSIKGIYGCFLSPSLSFR